MVDVVDTAPPEAGYDQDFHAWTQAQAAALRKAARDGVSLPVDWENVAEEIESLGKSEANALRSRIRTIIEHLLKLELSPARDPMSGWRETVLRSRIDFDEQIKDSPSLRQRIPDWIEREHAAAVRLVEFNLRENGEWEQATAARLKARLYSTHEVLDDWWPGASDGPANEN